MVVPAPNIHTILFATDLGENTRPVFRMAVSQARRYKSRLVMLHVVEPLGPTGAAVVSNYLSRDAAGKLQGEIVHDILTIMKKRLEDFCKEELEAYGLDSIPEIDIMVLSGNPSEEILLATDRLKAGMIVLGQSTKSFFGSIAMGTTARRVSRYAKVPVLLIPNSK